MFQSHRIAVVVPAFNEATLITHVIDTMPAWVDAIVIVDDASTDTTVSVVRAHTDPRIRLCVHERNRGVGASITTGYRESLALGADFIAVMAGDAQMDPNDLHAVLTPLAQRHADYVKGNRLGHADIGKMPWRRRLGTWALGHLTSRALKLKNLGDSQCGYTAITRDAIEAIDVQSVWPRYGYPNDLLAHLSAARQRVVEVPVRPVYGAEVSGLRARHVGVILYLIARGAWRVRRTQTSFRST